MAGVQRARESYVDADLGRQRGAVGAPLCDRSSCRTIERCYTLSTCLWSINRRVQARPLPGNRSSRRPCAGRRDSMHLRTVLSAAIYYAYLVLSSSTSLHAVPAVDPLIDLMPERTNSSAFAGQ